VSEAQCDRRVEKQVSDFRHAVFFFESVEVPEDLRVTDGVLAAFANRPEAGKTLALSARTIDDAAQQLDSFKARTCGSPVTLAVLNLNMFPSVKELEFLLQGNVLGNPRTLFLASLKYMSGEIYALARDKVAAESAVPDRTPSCIDCYGAPNRNSVFPRVAELIGAYLQEAELRDMAMRSRGDHQLEPAAVQLLRKSETTFFGKHGASGRFRPVGESPSPTTSGRFRPLDSGSASGVRKPLS